MTWIRVDTSLEMDRRFRKLNGFGRALLQFLWRLAKKDEGTIGAADWDAEYFADMTGFPDSISDMKSQMELIVKLKLVDRPTGSEYYIVDNWEQFQKPKDWTNAQRQRDFRQRKKDAEVEPDSNPVTEGNTVTKLPVTRNGVRTGRTGRTGQTKDTRACAFNLFWNAWPSGYKVGKIKAERAFKIAAKKGMPVIDDLIASIEKQKLSQKWKDGFIPNPTTWLTGGGWDDELTQAGPKSGSVVAWSHVLKKMDHKEIQLTELEKTALESIGSMYDLRHGKIEDMPFKMNVFLKTYEGLEAECQ